MKKHFVKLLVMMAAIFFVGCKEPSVSITNLTCEYLTDPLGIDVTEPQLSWQLESGQRGQKQTAYHLLVASSPEKLKKNTGDLWDTEKVRSDQSIHVASRAKNSNPECPVIGRFVFGIKTGKRPTGVSRPSGLWGF
jgi:alpha-L-rhamnosidase